MRGRTLSGLFIAYQDFAAMRFPLPGRGVP